MKNSMNILLYVDPGTGSYIAQIAIAGFLGIMYAMRNWLRALFSKKKPTDSE